MLNLFQGNLPNSRDIYWRGEHVQYRKDLNVYSFFTNTYPVHTGRRGGADIYSIASQDANSGRTQQSWYLKYLEAHLV